MNINRFVMLTSILFLSTSIANAGWLKDIKNDD